MILPEGKTAEIIKSIARLACTVAILSPILSFFVDAECFDFFFKKTVIDTDKAFIEYSSKLHVDSTETMIENQLRERFECEVDASIEWSLQTTKNGQYSVEKVRIDNILVFAAAEQSARESIQEFLSSTYACKAEVRAWNNETMPQENACV